MTGNSGISIAVAGKGGSGKTTISGLMIAAFARSASGRVLAVDADPSANLGFVLGVESGETLGGIREETIENMIEFPSGMSKARYLELRIQQAVRELDSFDLLTMGRTEGPGCYCFVNRLLRTALDTLARNYPRVLMDCEAGLEHVSRRTSRSVDHLVVVSDLSLRGLDVALRIARLVDSLSNGIGRKHLFLNRCRDGREEALIGKVERVMSEGGYATRTTIPEDPDLFGIDLTEGKSIFDLSAEGGAASAVREFLKKEQLL
jgi:CO dehydrogenase maturation factor